MRYTIDVVNAENWNTDLKKSLTHNKAGAGNTAKHQKSGTSKTGQPNQWAANTRVSKKKTGKKNKRGMFLLSGLLSGLVSRGRNNK